MKSPNNWEIECRCPFFVTKWSSQCTDQIISNYIVYQEVPWQSAVNPRCCQDYRLFSTTWWQGLIADGNTYTTHWMCKSQVGVYIDHSPSDSVIFGTVIMALRRRNTININTKAAMVFNLHGILPARYSGTMVAQGLGGEEPTTVWFDLRPIPWNGNNT